MNKKLGRPLKAEKDHSRQLQWAKEHTPVILKKNLVAEIDDIGTKLQTELGFHLSRPQIIQHLLMKYRGAQK